MDKPLPDILRQAAALLRSGQIDKARPLLAAFVQKNPQSDTAWFLLGQTIHDPKQQADCLRQALRANPENTLARQALERILGGTATDAPPPVQHPQPPPSTANAKPQTWYVHTPPPNPNLDFWTDDEPEMPFQQSTTEAPDWLNQPASTYTPPAQSGSIPDWLTESAPAEADAPAAKPFAPSEELPEWLRGSAQPEASTPTPAQPAAPTESIPDWLVESVQPEASAPAAPSTSPAAAELPPWLVEDTPARPPAQAIPPQKAHPQPTANIPSWLAFNDTPPDTSAFAPDKPAAHPPKNVEAPLLSDVAAPEKGQAETANKRRSKRSEVVIATPTDKTGKKTDWTAIVILGGIVIVCLIAVAAGVWFFTQSNVGAPPQAGSGEETVLPPTEEALILQPTWTPTNTWTPTPTPPPTEILTATPTPTPQATPTPLPPPPTALAQMERIEQEVAEIRGLPMVIRTEHYLINRMAVERMLRAELQTEESQTWLANEAHSLIALGFIPTDYDLLRYAMNNLVDNFGGFYRPSTKAIYVIGSGFGLIERYVYSHEFTHALVDQTFSLETLKSSENCSNEDRCQAISALIEGDANLTMSLWLKEYATAKELRELTRYKPPSLALPDQTPPDYIIQQINFPYQYGFAFVNALYAAGQWDDINNAYFQPPASTEQIMDVQKYLANEQPIPVQDLPLSTVLSTPWRLAKTNPLGQWGSYLLLTQSADRAARRANDEAAIAAAGWGGDQYQVYVNDQTSQYALAVHWIWDTPADASEFVASLEASLGQRFYGRQIERPAGLCWQTDNQATCSYLLETENLWLQAPDAATLDLLLSLYPQFSTQP